MKIYLAGPMRGKFRYNFEVFDCYANIFRAEGHEVINPAEIDRKNGFDPAKLPDDFDWRTIPVGFDLNRCILEDIKAVVEADAIFLLSGWESSAGARAEQAVAFWAGKKLYYEATIKG